jgi:hypothetical protein
MQTLIKSQPDPATAPRCWQCRHFGMSYHRQTPYACRLMGIESRILPAIEVLRADGMPCRGFSPKSTLRSPPG